MSDRPAFRTPAAGEKPLVVEEAQSLVMQEITPGEIESVPLPEALQRILREDVAIGYDMPEADNSAMDGYAIRAEDALAAPVSLRVIGDIAAGSPSRGEVLAGTAMRIMTGALLPNGADAVIQVEWTDGGADQVRVMKPVSRGANIRRRGEDLRAGSVVLATGTRIGAAEIALLAAAEKTSVRVARQPTVAILSTGDELVEPGEERSAGKIVNTNGYLLEALVRYAGGSPRRIEIVRDDRDETIAALESALESDYVITSGGVSVGSYDFVKEALEALGAETKFWRVSMKPGKPVVLSRLRDRLCFGLPGNPAACFVSFHLFVAPALRKAMGASGSLFPSSVMARLASPLRSAGDRRLYARVAVVAENGELYARPLVTQGSGALTSMAGANGLVVVPEGVRSLGEGELVQTLLLGVPHSVLT